ncbi:MAG: hypothetical protein OER95_15750, partial [Acidimicrobiia bacterium]|nr:hypothetical protein [Acidimicrobiia bacterium]
AGPTSTGPGPIGLIRQTHDDASVVGERADRVGMRWSPRFIGLAVLASLLAWSYTYAVGEIGRVGTAPAISRSGSDNEITLLESSGGDDTPRYLAFTGGIPSGVYRVADLETSNDWDYGERGGRTPEAPSISEGNTVNYNVEVEDGPHVTGARSGRSDGSDDASDDADSGESGGEDGGRVDDSDDALPSIRPGLYATRFGVENCEYELRRIMDDNRDHVIGHDQVHEGRILVSLNEYEPDTFVATDSCGEWSPWSPLVEPVVTAGDGDYWVGDLAVGLWDVPAGCLWEKVVSFRGSQLDDVEASGIGPTPLRVDQFTLGLRVRHCSDEPMTLSDEPLPPQLPIADLEAAREAAHRRPPMVDRELTAWEARRLERRRR